MNSSGSNFSVDVVKTNLTEKDLQILIKLKSDVEYILKDNKCFNHNGLQTIITEKVLEDKRVLKFIDETVNKLLSSIDQDELEMLIKNRIKHKIINS